MSISLKLIDTEAEIEKRINEALSVQINDILLKNRSNIVNQVVALIPKWINNQPEIQAILSNSLTGEFGLDMSPANIVNAIIGAVSSSISIKFKKYNKNLSGGGLDLEIQQSDFANLLLLRQGHTIYFKRSPDSIFATGGGDLHWLEWMLLRGDEIIVVGYEYNPKTGLGRTGLGNMVPGNGFRVPPQYSGTKDNNFITRALIGQEQEKDITEIFKKVLGA